MTVHPDLGTNDPPIHAAIQTLVVDLLDPNDFGMWGVPDYSLITARLSGITIDGMSLERIDQLNAGLLNPEKRDIIAKTRDAFRIVAQELSPYSTEFANKWRTWAPVFISQMNFFNAAFPLPEMPVLTGNPTFGSTIQAVIIDRYDMNEVRIAFGLTPVEELQQLYGGLRFDQITETHIRDLVDDRAADPLAQRAVFGSWFFTLSKISQAFADGPDKDRVLAVFDLVQTIYDLPEFFDLA